MSVLHNGGRAQTAVLRDGARALAFIAADRRADGAVRNVSIARRRVLIERRVAGIAMHIGVAATAYRGVSLSLDACRSGAGLYRVNLVHLDPDLSIELYAARHDRDVVAEWQAWAAYFGLPKLVEQEPGRFETAETLLGAVTIGRGAKLRRRGAILSKRRPRIRWRRRAPSTRPNLLPGEQPTRL